MKKFRKVRSNHNSLFNYFIYDKEYLSKEYVNKCERFIDDLGKENQKIVLKWRIKMNNKTYIRFTKDDIKIFI